MLRQSFSEQFTSILGSVQAGQNIKTCYPFHPLIDPEKLFATRMTVYGRVDARNFQAMAVCCLEIRAARRWVRSIQMPKYTKNGRGRVGGHHRRALKHPWKVWQIKRATHGYVRRSPLPTKFGHRYTAGSLFPAQTATDDASTFGQHLATSGSPPARASLFTARLLRLEPSLPHLFPTADWQTRSLHTSTPFQRQLTAEDFLRLLLADVSQTLLPQNKTSFGSRTTFQPALSA